MHDVIASATKIIVVTNDKQLFVAKVSNCLPTKKNYLVFNGNRSNVLTTRSDYNLLYSSGYCKEVIFI